MKDLAQQVTQWIYSIIGDEVEVTYSKLSTTAEVCAMVKTVPCDPVVKKYCAGGGIYRFAYGVVLCVSPRKTQDRFDALALLRKIQSAIEAQQFPQSSTSFISHTTTQIPNLLSVEDNGDELYLLEAELTYLERG